MEDIIDNILNNKNRTPSREHSSAFANTNIALIKYWGKRDESLILPVTSSLSYTLKGYGTHTYISRSNIDSISLNGHLLPPNCDFSKRILEFLSLFRDKNTFFKIETYNNFPTSAGLASSASGAAALVMAIDKIYDWNLNKKELSILARLISGSGCRSVYDCDNPFVLWDKGVSDIGIDSFATQLSYKWPNLCFRIISIMNGDIVALDTKIIGFKNDFARYKSNEPKKKSSRETMKDAFTSPYYAAWEQIVEYDIKTIMGAIKHKDFDVFGQTLERNSLYMHKIIETTKNPICFFSKETLSIIEAVKKLRKNMPIYFTIDAGPNVVVFFLQEHENAVNKWLESYKTAL